MLLSLILVFVDIFMHFSTVQFSCFLSDWKNRDTLGTVPGDVYQYILNSAYIAITSLLFSDRRNY